MVSRLVVDADGGEWKTISTGRRGSFIPLTPLLNHDFRSTCSARIHHELGNWLDARVYNFLVFSLLAEEPSAGRYPNTPPSLKSEKTSSLAALSSGTTVDYRAPARFAQPSEGVTCLLYEDAM